MKTYDEIRTAYLNFFRARGHVVIPSAPLVPQNDPTTLFTGSGMQPLVPYLLGKEHPAGTRLTDSQKSFRSMDIEEVGDNRHTTFFEMLGNWSLGDYFKKEQLSWFFEFLTDELKLDPGKLYVTVYSGSEDGAIPQDTESISIWIDLFATKQIPAGFADMTDEKGGYARGMKEGERIFAYRDKNWWSRAGEPAKMPPGEPGGPDSEVFYDFGTPHDETYGVHCHPNCDCGRFLEIGNSVFMEYLRTEGGFEKLPKRNVDFGGGLERLAAAMNNEPDVFKSGVLATIIETIAEHAKAPYGVGKNTAAYRVVADHMRAAIFLIADGVKPSNTDQGYFVRRLLRRSIRFSDTLALPEGTLAGIVPLVAAAYADAYPEIATQISDIRAAIDEEEQRFRKTLTRGLALLQKTTEGKGITGEDAFMLFTTYGFPIELTEEIAKERGASVDRAAFDRAMEQHRSESRSGAEKRFKGGLADQSEATVRLHTTHHLLLRALQQVLGEGVKQRGSNITGERLRIDFSHSVKMTEEQKREVERIVNEKIQESLPVIRSEMPREEAEKLHAEHEFGAKYPDMVSVYSIGPKDATRENPRFENAFSIEFCGGPHVENTKDIGSAGVFRIQKEEAAAAGIRRIKGVLE